MKNYAPKYRFTRSKESPVTAGDTLVASLKVANGLPEIAFAALKQSGLAMLDGVHNLADISYIRQLTAIRRHARGQEDNTPQPSQEERRKHRRNTYRLMSWTALGAAGMSGYGTFESLQGEEPMRFDVLSYGHLGTTMASLALSGALVWVGGKMQRAARNSDNLELTKDIDDFYVHAKLDLGSSAAAVVGAGVQTTGHGLIDHVAGMALGMYQAARFWPSDANLERGLVHSHSGAHEH
ncbi:MAG TPA: hypothetical protein VFI74_04530 [Candidatus Saccharimonadales bacterium]|nr:hypothetical protein [Candidatus Saccharimonadales bacterium]